MDCPVCNKQYPAAQIETHVNKCLFLTEATSNKLDGNNKRSSPFTSIASEPLAKQAKYEQSSIADEEQNDKPVLGGVEKKVATISTDVAKKMVGKENSIGLGKDEHVPLAERVRPVALSTYVGQQHVLGPKSVLRDLLDKGQIPSMILWGPPGCGKTSLANVIAHTCRGMPGGKIRYVKLSTACSSVGDVKEIAKQAQNDLKFGRRTVMFMDEIHRFNKLQQDIFLPHVEAGTLTLIGATTENPSFSLNSALLSRCRVVVLQKLPSSDLIDIIENAVRFMNGVIYAKPIKSESKEAEKNARSVEEEDDSKVPVFIIDSATVQWLAETCDGDARIALGGLELAIKSKCSNSDDIVARPSVITLNDVQESLKKTHMLYDRKGDQHYEMISALHKSVRASDDNAALYWLARMMAGGEDPVYIARRLVRMASEDIGLADPQALGIAVATMDGCKMIGMPECDVLLAQCATYLSRAPKSRLMEDALRSAQKLVADHKGPQPGVPLHLRNAPTKLMGQLGYGKYYNMLHKDESGLKYMPEGLEDVDFFDDGDSSSGSMT